MAAAISPERLLQMLETYWRKIPPAYRAPVLLTSCAALILTPLAWKKLTYVPELLPPPPKDYPYRLPLLAQAASATFTLPDGRQLGYAQYGDPSGKPIIALHGLLGSRLEAALFDTDAKQLHARILAPERPGIGRSSPDPRPLQARRVRDHAHDVAALAAHLQLREYAVLGTSGGGPYALGCAAAAAAAADASPSRRLRAVAIVTGLGLPDMSQAWPRVVVFLNSHLDLRWLMRWLFARSPAWQLHLSDDERAEALRRELDAKRAHPADVATARHPDYPDWTRLFLCSAREAVAQGWDGFLDDAALLSRDPGFRVEEVRADLAVQLWYGTDDTNVSPRAGEETAQRLRAGGNTRVELHMEEGETHGSTQVKYRRRVLEDLLRAMDS